jgi:hypothetical protein
VRVGMPADNARVGGRAACDRSAAHVTYRYRRRSSLRAYPPLCADI